MTEINYGPQDEITNMPEVLATMQDDVEGIIALLNDPANPVTEVVGIALSNLDSVAVALHHYPSLYATEEHKHDMNQLVHAKLTGFAALLQTTAERVLAQTAPAAPAAE